ncbi:MAG: hypothetical protein Q9O24_02245 [Gammaproteobacteria bacterium]|nr:hypothetical protein [Gammaproteobacteria bacterium]
MSRLLSLSRAARLAGVSRGEIQAKIRMGVLTTFEGSVKLDNLLVVYPELDVEESGMIERTARIRANAHTKYQHDCLPSEAQLAAEVNRLKVELSSANAKIENYHHLVMSLKERLLGMRAECTHQQKAMLQAVVHWMSHKVEHWK